MKIQNIVVPGYKKILEATFSSGIKSIIAIHNTNRGPALGGVRFFPYANEKAALTDACRLAEGMSYKAALADLALGGGKAVIMGDPQKMKTKGLLEEFGAFVDSLMGEYITAKDVGITIEDLAIIAGKTHHVVGFEGEGKSGDPSPVTAYGVFLGVREGVKAVWGDKLNQKTVIVQGLGHVGWSLAQHLVQAGACVLACDIDPQNVERAVKELGVLSFKPDIWDQIPADILAPCAMGGTLDPKTIPHIIQNEIRLVAGAANNQLLDQDNDGRRLHENKVLYAPDYVINAGGLINVACELEGYNREKAIRMTERIPDVLREIFELSQRQNRPTSTIALELARKRIDTAPHSFANMASV